MLSASRWNRGKKFTGCNRPIRRRVTKLHDWFALVNKYFRGKIMRTSLPLTEIWPISDRFIKQKYYCITVHYRTVCTSHGKSSRTNCPNWTANSRTSGTIFGLCPMADAKLNPCICFDWEIRKIFFWYALLTKGLITSLSTHVCLNS